MEHQPSFPRKKALRFSLLAACTILSALFQAAVATASQVTSATMCDMSISAPGNTTQTIPSNGSDSVEISPPGNVTLPLGSPLTLTCRADSVPSPQYSWFFNSIRRNVTAYCFAINSTSLEDAGEYECCAYNEAANTSLCASVFVRITTDQESSSARLEQLLKIAFGVSSGLVVVVMLLTGILLYRFCSKRRGENSPLTRSTASIYDDASPAAHGTKPETSADLPSNPYQTLQYEDEAIYEEPQK